MRVHKLIGIVALGVIGSNLAWGEDLSFSSMRDFNQGNSVESVSTCEREQQLPPCSSGYYNHCCPDYEGPPIHCSGNYKAMQTTDGHWTCGRIPGGNR